MDGKCGCASSDVLRSGVEPRLEARRSTGAFSRDSVRYRATPRRTSGFAGSLVDAPHRVIARAVRRKGQALRARRRIDGVVGGARRAGRGGRDRYAPRRVFSSLGRKRSWGRRRVGTAVVPAACVLMVVLWLVGGSAACAERASLAGCASIDAAAVSTSTPVSEWRQGQMPYLYQIDAAWSGESYAGGTIGENGCGPTALSMVLIDVLGGTKWDPASLAAWSERNGYVEGGATRWALMSEGAARLGLASWELPADATSVREALQAGNPVVCVVGPGDFTTTGHFIVLAGLNGDGTVDVHDPNSPENSHKAWNLERILRQSNNLWAFSAG